MAWTIFNADDVATSYDDWLNFLVELEDGGSEFEVYNSAWEMARQSEEIPHLGNALQSACLSALSDAIERAYPDISFEFEIYVNAIATTFCVKIEDGCFESIRSKEDFDKLLADYKKSNGELEDEEEDDDF